MSDRCGRLCRPISAAEKKNGSDHAPDLADIVRTETNADADDTCHDARRRVRAEGRASDQDAAHVGQEGGQVAVPAGGGGAVDDAVVV
jgi:hypothetical protein